MSIRSQGLYIKKYKAPVGAATPQSNGGAGRAVCQGDWTGLVLNQSRPLLLVPSPYTSICFLFCNCGHRHAISDSMPCLHGN